MSRLTESELLAELNRRIILENTPNARLTKTELVAEVDRRIPDPPPPPPPPTVKNRPANPGCICYGSTAGSVSAWAKPGALVVAGRDNYDAAAFHTVAAGGATVLIYLDTIIDNVFGRYHSKLIQASEFGPAVPKWPGNPVANQYGSLNDFRVGSVLQSKLPGVIDLIVSENPHCSGIFLDDCGSRSWYPGFNWDSWSAADREAYRSGAIQIVKTARAKADQHNLFIMVNGTWGATSSTGAGDGGYPNRAVPGMSLADGGFIENHGTSEGSYWKAYAAQSAQWGTGTPRKIGYNWFSNVGDVAAQNYWVSSDVAAFASTNDYGAGFPAPWRGFTDFGLPRR